MIAPPADSAARFLPGAQMPDTSQLLEIDRRHVIHPLHHVSDHQAPLLIARGDGPFLHTADGREIIDGLSGLWNVNIGHGRKELAAAAAKQMERLAFASAYVGATNEPAVRLAERLVDISYSNISAVYFTTAGAESNESAFKFARYYWKVKGKPAKTKFVSRIHGYHGVTMAAMSATGMAAYHKMFGPLVPGFVQVPAPYPYRWSGKTEPGQGAADALEERILAEGPGTVAAVIAEPGARSGRRAGEGRGGRHRPARHLLAGAPPHLRQARRAADRRRGHHRVRPHRPGVRARPVERRAGPRLVREGRDLGIHSARRCPRLEEGARGPDLGSRRSEVHARRDLFGAPRLLRGRARQPRHHREGRVAGAGGDDGKVPARRTAHAVRPPRGRRRARARYDVRRRAGR